MRLEAATEITRDAGREAKSNSGWIGRRPELAAYSRWSGDELARADRHEIVILLLKMGNDEIDRDSAITEE
jgi:hypothetical protein